MGIFAHVEMPYPSSKLVRMENCYAFENARPKETDNLSGQDQSLYGMKTRRVCEDGQTARRGAQVASTAGSWLIENEGDTANEETSR